MDRQEKVVVVDALEKITGRGLDEAEKKEERSEKRARKVLVWKSVGESG